MPSSLPQGPPAFRNLRQAAQTFSASDAGTSAAALSFYAITAIPPLVILLTAILGLVVSDHAAAKYLVTQAHQSLGPETAVAIEGILQRRAQAANGPAAFFGLLVLLVGASGFFVHLQKALNSLWGVQPDPQAGWKDTLVKRIASMGVVLSTGLLLLLSLLTSTVVSAAQVWLQQRTAWSFGWLRLSETFLSLALLTALLALLLKYLPDATVAWGDVWRAALTTAVLFSLGKIGLGWYLARSDLSADYGSAGALVLTLFWVYYSCMLLLFGAALTRAKAQARLEERGNGWTP